MRYVLIEGTKETAVLLRQNCSSFTIATLDAQTKLVGAAESSAQENLALRVRYGRNIHICLD